MSRAFCAALLATISSVLIAAPPDSDIDPAVRTILLSDLKFSAAELSDLQRGKSVRHSLPTRAPGEVAVVGAIRINVPKAAFFADVRDITHFKRGPDVLEIGRFSHPPVLEDLATLTVDEDDFDARGCRVGDCGIRLPADAIDRVRNDVDSNATDAQARTAAWFKTMLLAQVTAYTTGGPGRFSQFDDGPMPIRPVDAFVALAGEGAATINSLAAGLSDHLLHFPETRLADGEDFLYWSKEKFGVAPFISVTHVALVCPTAATCVMATKDVYSSRYFDASLALAIATDVAGHPDSFYLVYANRSRANALKGAFAAFRRAIVERRARNGLEESLKTIKSRLEDARK
jgi:hypothetical protein